MKENSTYETQEFIDIKLRSVERDFRYKLPCDSFGDSSGVVTSKSLDWIPMIFEKE